MLKDKRWYVRSSAAEALKTVDDPKARVALLDLEEKHLAQATEDLLEVLKNPELAKRIYKGEHDNPYLIKAVQDMVRKSMK